MKTSFFGHGDGEEQSAQQGWSREGS